MTSIYAQPPVSPSIMYDQLHNEQFRNEQFHQGSRQALTFGHQPKSALPSQTTQGYLQALQQALQPDHPSYRPSYVTPQPKLEPPAPKVDHVPEEIVFCRGRALLYISSWSVAQKALKSREKLIGFFSDDGGCTYFCPVITNEAEMQYFLQRFAPRIVAMIGLGQGPNDTPHPLVIRPMFYALIC